MTPDHARSTRAARGPVRVHKFGGAALADGSGVRRVCGILRRAREECSVAVVSALAGVTTALDRCADVAARGERADTRALRQRHRSVLAQLGLDSELCDRHLTELALLLQGIASRGRILPEERDHVLSFGERLSARIVAAALRADGTPATPVDAFDLGLLSDSNHGRARPLPASTVAVRAALRTIPGVAVITGFVAADSSGRLTTLGRNGSDLTAALVAEAAGATEVCFWKAVGGVMTADPHLVPSARTHPSLSWSQARAYARSGAHVLHPDTLEPLARAGIPARVRGLDDPDAGGTRIGESEAESGPIGIACARVERDVGAVVVCGSVDEGRSRAALERNGIPVMATSAGVEPERSTRLLVSEELLPRAAGALHSEWFEA